jgi:hypothetical protein
MWFEESVMSRIRYTIALCCLLLWPLSMAWAQPPEGLSLWNEGAVKQAIVGFVREVTDPDGAAFVPPADRIAVFDLDGTLVCERPRSFGMAFVQDQLQSLSALPAMRERQPYQAVREGRGDAFRRRHFEMYFCAATAGLSESEVAARLRAFARRRHPRFERAYRALFYRPMLQLVRYLAAHDFVIYVLSASDQTAVRILCAECPELAGLPPDRFVGTLTALRVDYTDQGPVFYRVARELEPVNLREGKSRNILYRIGRNPVLAVGNSAGDCGLLASSLGSGYPRSLRLLLDHDDGEREYAYPFSGRAGMPCAKQWAGFDSCPGASCPQVHVISMKRDFRQLFAPLE